MMACLPRSRSAHIQRLWASGLPIASSHGYRDANEASWTQLVQSVERTVDSTELPVLIDGDGGFGSFNNARLRARKLRQVAAAGLSLEHSCFPKLNSLTRERHPLADIDEFSGRLRAIKDAVAEHLLLVARIEALIAGRVSTKLSCVATQVAYEHGDCKNDGITTSCCISQASSSTK